MQHFTISLNVFFITHLGLKYVGLIPYLHSIGKIINANVFSYPNFRLTKSIFSGFNPNNVDIKFT